MIRTHVSQRKHQKYLKKKGKSTLTVGMENFKQHHLKKDNSFLKHLKIFKLRDGLVFGVIVAWSIKIIGQMAGEELLRLIILFSSMLNLKMECHMDIIDRLDNLVFATN